MSKSSRPELIKSEKALVCINVISTQRKQFSDTDNDFQFPENFPNAAKPWQMRIKFKATAQTSERCNVSDHASAVIASSISQDLGLITDIETSKVIDKIKMRRERSCVSKKSLKFSPESALRDLFFYGRKDTLAFEKIDSKYFRRSKKEDHDSFIHEPG